MLGSSSKLRRQQKMLYLQKIKMSWIEVEEVAKVTAAEARAAIQTLRRFAEQQEKGDPLISHLGIIEDRVEEITVESIYNYN